MNDLAFIFIFACVSVVSACDPQEMMAIAQISMRPSYYIFGIDELFEGSFNKSIFSEFVGFEDTFLPLPIMSNRFLLKKPLEPKCEERSEYIDTLFWELPPFISLSGTLYGCSPFHSKPVRIIVPKVRQWNRNDEVNLCSSQIDIPAKYFEGANNCQQKMNEFIRKCKLQAEEDIAWDFHTMAVVLALAVVVFVAFYFLEQLVRCLMAFSAMEVCPLSKTLD